MLSNRPTRTINIQGPVASPPIVTGTSGTPVAWTEALPPASAPVVTIAPGLTITDGSTGQLTSATVTISQNFSSGEDVLGWNATVAAANNITVTSSPHSHFITLAPTTPDTSESLAAFQAVLRTVTYTNTSQKPTAVPRTVTFTVVDSNSITSTVTASSQQVVSVTAVNNPPLITTSGGTDSYVVNAPAVLIDGSLTLTDPDNASLVGATVKITGGFASGDTLAFNNQGGIAGTYVPATGVLTLTGSATPLEYQIALRAVTFSTSAAAGLRTISFQADDNATPGTPDGNVATKQIAVSSSGSGAGAFFAELGGGSAGGAAVSVSNASLGPAIVAGSNDQDAQTLLLTELLASNSAASLKPSTAALDLALSDGDANANDYDLSATTQTDSLAGEERGVALLAPLNQGIGFE